MSAVSILLVDDEASIRAFIADYAALVRRLVRMWRTEHQTLRFFIASAVSGRRKTLRCQG